MFVPPLVLSIDCFSRLSSLQIDLFSNLAENIFIFIVVLKYEKLRNVSAFQRFEKRTDRMKSILNSEFQKKDSSTLLETWWKSFSTKINLPIGEIKYPDSTFHHAKSTMRVFTKNEISSRDGANFEPYSASKRKKKNIRNTWLRFARWKPRWI